MSLTVSSLGAERTNNGLQECSSITISSQDVLWIQPPRFTSWSDVGDDPNAQKSTFPRLKAHKVSPIEPENDAEPEQKQEADLEVFRKIIHANNEASAAPSTHSYGRLIYSSKRMNMEAWLHDVPYHWVLKDAFLARPVTLAIYNEWLRWSRSSAVYCLTKLDTYEQQFRHAGVQYHKILFPLRHSTAMMHDEKVENSVLMRLGQIFETNRTRSKQVFFGPWMTISHVAMDMIREIDLVPSSSEPENSKLMQAKLQKLDHNLEKLARPLHNLETGLSWLEQSIAHLVLRADEEGGKQVMAKHSREGGLFRQWIHTFPEIERGDVGSSPEYVEQYAEQILESGVQVPKCWAPLADKVHEAENSP